MGPRLWSSSATNTRSVAFMVERRAWYLPFRRAPVSIAYCKQRGVRSGSSLFAICSASGFEPCVEAMPSHTCLFSSSPKLWAYLRSALVLILLLVVLLVLPVVLVLLILVVLVLVVVLVEVHGEIPPEFICGFPAGVVCPVPAVSFQASFCLLDGKSKRLQRQPQWPQRCRRQLP